MTDETILLQGSTFRVFRCIETDQGRTWKFYCPHCKVWHRHGAGEGHRNAHCSPDSPLWAPGYYLKLEGAE